MSPVLRRKPHGTRTQMARHTEEPGVSKLISIQLNQPTRRPAES
jgi:hypothetical protein